MSPNIQIKTNKNKSMLMIKLFTLIYCATKKENPMPYAVGTCLQSGPYLPSGHTENKNILCELARKKSAKVQKLLCCSF